MPHAEEALLVREHYPAGDERVLLRPQRVGPLPGDVLLPELKLWKRKTTTIIVQSLALNWMYNHVFGTMLKCSRKSRIHQALKFNNRLARFRLGANQEKIRWEVPLPQKAPGKEIKAKIRQVSEID